MTVVCAGGVLAVYLTGGPTYFIELKIYPLAIFFEGVYISLSEIFLQSVDQKIINSNLFSATHDVRKKCCFLTGILGVKFHTRVFFGGLQYEALLQPPLNPVYCEYPTWGCMLRVHSVT